MGRGGKNNDDDGFKTEPSTNFAHISYTAMTDRQCLVNAEEIYFGTVIRFLFANLAAAAFGSYMSAKVFLFQDRFGAAVIAAFFCLILENSAIINKTTRALEALAVFFFGSCCLSTILWWNIGYDQWDIARIMVAFTLCPVFYHVPIGVWMVANGRGSSMFGKKKRKPKTSEEKVELTEEEKNKREQRKSGKLRFANSTPRSVYYVFGPLVIFFGLWVIDLVGCYVSQPLLTMNERVKITMVFGIWAAFYGQFLVKKAQLYGTRDFVWNNIMIIPETLMAFVLVPWSIISPDEGI